MRTRWALVVGLAGALGAGAMACDTSTSSPNTDCSGSGADATITASDAQTFTPAAATVSVGQSVCWQNSGSVAHTVSSDDGTEFDSGLGANNFTHTFAAAGVFPYHCKVHPGMVGTITVE